MPSITELVGTELGVEFIYRWASAILHGKSSAMAVVSFQIQRDVEQDITMRSEYNYREIFLEKNIKPFIFTLLCQEGARNFIKPIWYQCQLFGFDHVKFLDAVREQLEILSIDSSQLFTN